MTASEETVPKLKYTPTKKSKPTIVQVSTQEVVANGERRTKPPAPCAARDADAATSRFADILANLMKREGKKEMTTSKDVLGELLESVMNIAGGDDGTDVTQVLSDLADVILKDKDVADVNRTAERRQQKSTSQHKINNRWVTGTELNFW